VLHIVHKFSHECQLLIVLSSRGNSNIGTCILLAYRWELSILRGDHTLGLENPVENTLVIREGEVGVPLLDHSQPLSKDLGVKLVEQDLIMHGLFMDLLLYLLVLEHLPT
jgi:hypothetical protein